MANVDRNMFFDMSHENEDGTFGKYKLGYRDPDTHVIHFGEPTDATDAAREKAVELGVDVNSVEGTGSEGRVTASDVEKAAKG